jgi:hypothetical protein
MKKSSKQKVSITEIKDAAKKSSNKLTTDQLSQLITLPTKKEFITKLKTLKDGN